MTITLVMVTRKSNTQYTLSNARVILIAIQEEKIIIFVTMKGHAKVNFDL